MIRRWYTTIPIHTGYNETVKQISFPHYSAKLVSKEIISIKNESYLLLYWEESGEEARLIQLKETNEQLRKDLNDSSNKLTEERKIKRNHWKTILRLKEEIRLLKGGK